MTFDALVAIPKEFMRKELMAACFNPLPKLLTALNPELRVLSAEFLKAENLLGTPLAEAASRP